MPESSNDQEIFRVWMLYGLMLCMMFGLLGFLWDLQVVRGTQFTSDITRQSVRRVRLPELRGKIYDRNDIVLADNRPSHCIGIYIEELREPPPRSRTLDRVENIIQEISVILEMQPVVNRREIEKHTIERLPLPLLAFRDLDELSIARFAELVEGYPGVEIYTEAVRDYAFGSLAAHTIGYVGRGGMGGPEEEPYHYYLPQMEGKAGIERSMDKELRGEAGGELIRVDVSGFRHEVIGSRKPRNGKDLQLTIDTRIQKICESVLEGEMGAIAVMNPNNGDLLAMASYPGYDLNKWIPKISSSYMNQLNSDSRKPFLNRVSGGSYAPGSTFKPIVCLAAMENGKADPSTSFFCPGYIEFGSRKMHCGYRNGHGTLNMQQALERSCNVYFFKLGIETGWDYVYHMASALGLGRRTQIPLGANARGILPDAAWKRDKLNEGWREGDTANASIGQGYLTVSPLQMVGVISAIANGGSLYEPRLVRAVRASDQENWVERPTRLQNKLAWSPESLNVVQQGLRDVIMGERGTGRMAALRGLDYAGKTGTAQFGARSQGKYRAWMIAYAPFDNPKYAIALALDEAGSSGLSAAPKMKQLLQGLFAGQLQGGGL